jgi:hypothetical protein
LKENAIDSPAAAGDRVSLARMAKTDAKKLIIPPIVFKFTSSQLKEIRILKKIHKIS